MKHHYKRFNLIFLFISCLLLHSQCQICDTCVDLAFYSCIVCYNSCSNVSSPFKNCSWTYCAEETGSDSDGTGSSCLRYETQYLPQNQCFGKCCSPSNIDYFTVNQLNNCEAKSKQNIKIGIIVGSVLGGVFILVFIACFIFSGACKELCCNCRNSCGCDCQCDCGNCKKAADFTCYFFTCGCLRSKLSQPGQIQQVHAAEMNSMTHLSWQEEAKPNQKLNDEEESCSICFSVRANLMTACGHYFHAECIEAWYKKSQKCPLCRSENISQVKFFCRGCLQRCIRFNLKIDKNIADLALQMKGPNCPTCQ